MVLIYSWNQLGGQQPANFNEFILFLSLNIITSFIIIIIFFFFSSKSLAQQAVWLFKLVQFCYAKEEK